MTSSRGIRSRVRMNVESPVISSRRRAAGATETETETGAEIWAEAVRTAPAVATTLATSSDSWAGSGKVAALDTLRAMVRSHTRWRAFFAELELAAGTDARHDDALA